ncbi:MAG: type VII secretion-associated serine protease mycosin [Segniliparus sp.]|uniref:type VII secretion-associated serine protease mycosin n=1 Tax=Segniliparus sp. TaxID=2804064 RepID=UPI003F33ABA6
MARLAARAASATTATLLVFGSTAQPAFADSGFDGPPAITAAPPSGQVLPELAYEQKFLCRAGEHLPNSDFKVPTLGQRSLDLDAAHKISTGAGVRVAVIDTGVSTVPGRLDDVEGGGDYVQGEGQGSHGGDTNGLDDCDLHGTFAAGIIAAKAKPSTDAFVGVAPDAHIISIRQSSDLFGVKGSENTTAGTLHTLAQAIVHAAGLGAKVIDIAVGSCFAVEGFAQNTALTTDQEVGAALRYAAEEKDAVVVTSAGFINESCASNPFGAISPGQAQSPSDKAQWRRARTVMTPAWHSQWALAVGWSDQNGQGAGTDGDWQRQSTGTLAGPWVGIAAPGSEIVSLNPRPGEDVQGKPNADLADGTPAGDGKLQFIQGPSYAAAYVAGTAALIRAKYPELKAAEVIQRLEKFSRHPEGGWNPAVGYGVVDPVAALNGAEPAPLGPSSASKATSPAIVVGVISGAALLVFGAVLLIRFLFLRARRGQRP